MKENKRKKISGLRIFLLIFTLLIPQFASVRSAGAISIQDETAMGQRFLESIRKQFPFVDDDFVSDYLNDLGQYLIQSIDTRPFPFQFYLVRSSTLNAFAGPGGHIFAFSGLVSSMDSVDELASVLSHEIGHVTARHLSERMEQAKKIGIAQLVGMLAGILVGGVPGSAIASGSLAGGIQKQLGYSREDERQADQLGFQTMVKSGLDPEGMISTFVKLEKAQWQSADAIPPYLLTHPGSTERISNVESMLSSLNKRGIDRQAGKDQVKKLRDLYPFFRTIVQAKTGEPHEVEAEYKRELAKDPDSGLANFGLGVLWQDRSEYDKSIECYRKALKSQPDSLPVLRKLAESYQLKGLDKEAVGILEQAYRADTQDKASLFLLAKSYQNLEEDAKAIRIYERLLLLKPVKDEVYHNLGVSYGRNNRLALAHYNFGIYFRNLGEIGKARFHVKKAEELSKGDPAVAGKIRDLAAELRRLDRDRP